MAATNLPGERPNDVKLDPTIFKIDRGRRLGEAFEYDVSFGTLAQTGV